MSSLSAGMLAVVIQLELDVNDYAFWEFCMYNTRLGDSVIGIQPSGDEGIRKVSK